MPGMSLFCRSGLGREREKSWITSRHQNTNPVDDDRFRRNVFLRRVRRRIGEHCVEKELDRQRIFEGGEQRIVAPFARRHVLTVPGGSEDLYEEPGRVVVDVAVVLPDDVIKTLLFIIRQVK